MAPHRQKTLVFCTAYTHAAAGPFYTWSRRYRTWVDAIRATTLEYDQILLIDDGSAVLPDWPDAVLLRDGDDLVSDAPLVVYHFERHLGRRAVSDFPGWVRSFFFAATYAQANGFAKLIHIEADSFLISARIQHYVNDCHEGWISFFCPLFRRPESGIQIIAGQAMEHFAAFARQPVEALAGAVIEITLPFTHVETSFTGDRYGEYLDYVPVQAEWCSQAVPNGRMPLESYYWWLPGQPAPSPGAPTPVPVPIEALARDPQAAPGHHGVWYTDFFWHFDKTLRPRSYLEVGTNAGLSLRAFSCDAVCVDPHFVLDKDVLGPRKRAFFYQGASDAFFAAGELSRLFPDGFDVAFLDGLHLAEVLLRDFINAERLSRDGAVIFLHDCLPFNHRMAERERRVDETEPEATRDFWTGDVWKVLIALKTHRPDLKILALDCGPSGLIACMNLDRNATALATRYDEIVATFADLDLATTGLDALWALFPMLDSRALVENPVQMKTVFGGGWPAEPAP